MRNKKGFTLVELVIVIAVIAILAGVMIGTFASVVKKAKKSAEQQEMAAAKQEQVANDVIEKLNNGSWLGWTDFEEKLAKALADVNPNTPALTEASVKAAVAAALNEYAAAHPGTDKPNTGLTEQQVKYIIENALSGQLTAEQVKAIVNNAVSSTSTLTKSQVQAIVDAAVGKTISAKDVKDVVDEVIKANKLGTSTLTIEQIETLINSKNYSTLTDKEVEKIVKELLKNYSVSAVEVGSDKSLADTISNATTTTVAVKLTNDITEGSVVINKNTVIDLNGHNFTVPFNANIKVEAGKTLTIKGDSGKIIGDGTAISVSGNGQLVVDGGSFVNHKVEAPSSSCLIYCGQNAFLTINDGNFTIEDGCYYTIFPDKNSTTVINGGTFNGIAVSSNGSSTDNAACIINGGTFTQTIEESGVPTIYWPKGALSIYGGTFTGYTSVVAISGGSLNIYGGTFTTLNKVDGECGTSGTFASNETISIITNRSGYAFDRAFIGKDVKLVAAAGCETIGVYETTTKNVQPKYTTSTLTKDAEGNYTITK